MFHIYEVGMVSDVRKIKAQSAAAAALFYGVFCVRTNNPFMAVVYTEDGVQWEGDSYWVTLNPTEAHLEKVMTPLVDQIKAAELVRESEG